MVIRRKFQLLPSSMFLRIEVVSFTKSTMMTIQHSFIADWLSFSNWDIIDPKKETTVWQENEDLSCPPRWDFPSAEKCWLLGRSWGTFLTLNAEEMHFSASDLAAGKMIDGYNTFSLVVQVRIALEVLTWTEDWEYGYSLFITIWYQLEVVIKTIWYPLHLGNVNPYLKFGIQITFSILSFMQSSRSDWHWLQQVYTSWDAHNSRILTFIQIHTYIHFIEHPWKGLFSINIKNIEVIKLIT